MLHLARFAINRPRTTLVLWAVVAAVLVAIGAGVKGNLSPSVVVVPGTESSHAQTLADEQFGPSVLVPIMLQGPAAQLEAQGPRLVLDLSERSDTRVMSAWSSGPVGPVMRPNATTAMIIASVARSEKRMVKTEQAQIDKLVARDIAAPVTATVTGQPSIDRALKDEALDSARTAALIAVGVVFLVLLVLLQSPFAAATVAALGGVTVLASFGIVSVTGKVLDVDPLAVAVGAMAGLALTVGYGLIMVRRFREEETPERSRTDAMHAASTAVSSSGRAVLFGGTALIIALVLALTLSSMKVQASLGAVILTSTFMGIGSAVAVLPAVLVLFGHHLDAWRPAGLGVVGGAWNRLVGVGDRIVRRPAAIGALATAVLVALAVPVAWLSTGPPGITTLPKDNAARQSFEHVAKVMGPGFATPYNVLVVSRGAPLTSAAMLTQLARFQADIAKDKRVDTVLGPGSFTTQSTDLQKLPQGLDQSAAVAKSSKKDLAKLEEGLGLAGQGAAQLKSGLSSAASGAGQLQSGSSQAQTGAGTLQGYLAQARAGSAKLKAGLDTALSGAVALRDGAAQLLAGSKQIQSGLGQAGAPLKTGLPIAKQMAANAAAADSAISKGKSDAAATSGQISAALNSLQSVDAKNDPNYQAALSALQGAKGQADALTASLSNAGGAASAASVVAAGFAQQVGELSTGVSKLLAGSTALAAGIAKLQNGQSDLASGMKRLSTGGGDLTTALGQLEAGAGALESGLGQLTSGTGQLQSGLAGGVAPSGTLVAGLGTMEAAVAKARDSVPSTKDLETLKQQSPGLFDSGYFVLAAIQGAPSGDQQTAGFALNVDNGGNAGQIVVFPKQAATTQATQDLGVTLKDKADAFARTAKVETAVGGPAGNFADFRTFGEAHLWWVVAATVVAIALLMMVALRAVALPIVAVAFDTLGVLATFGVLSLLYDGSGAPLGGPGWLDPMSITGIFAVAFGFSVIYELLLLLRTRELFVENGDAHGSLRMALRTTAFAATGAGVVMTAAAIPFLFSDLISVQQFGVGVAVVVLLDVLITRPVLLPAATSILGDRAWWPTRGGSGPGPVMAPPPTSGRFARLAGDSAERERPVESLRNVEPTLRARADDVPGAVPGHRPGSVS